MMTKLPSDIEIEIDCTDPPYIYDPQMIAQACAGVDVGTIIIPADPAPGSPTAPDLDSVFPNTNPTGGTGLGGYTSKSNTVTIPIDTSWSTPGMGWARDIVGGTLGLSVVLLVAAFLMAVMRMMSTRLGVINQRVEVGMWHIIVVTLAALAVGSIGLLLAWSSGQNIGISVIKL